MPHRQTHIAAALAALALTGAPAAHAQTAAPAQAAPPTATGGAAFGEVGPTGLDVAPGALLGDTLEVSGTVTSAARRAVRVESLDPATGSWTPVADATAGPNGGFTVRWTPGRLGPALLRAVPGGGLQAQAASSAPTARTVVYRPARATWYGPGFWGRRTACGMRLRRTTLGVAHRSLPCGARISLYYDGRQVEVPVIDRGPFANRAAFDLTQAAARQVGMTQTSRIGWVRAGAPAPPAAPARAG